MRDGARRGGSKKCKPILAPPPLRGEENPHGAKRGGAGKNCHHYNFSLFKGNLKKQKQNLVPKSKTILYDIGTKKLSIEIILEMV